MTAPELPPPAPQRPFQITHLQRGETFGSGFVPDAFVQITPALRTSGLLQALAGEDLRHLLLVLTFVTPNGQIHPSLLELAEALGLSQSQTRTRLQPLERFAWQGKPLLHPLRRESGLDAYAPSQRLLQSNHASLAAPSGEDPTPVTTAGGRAAVLAHSRAAYARPRDEVEAEIARLNGWAWPFKSLAQVQEELRQKAQQPPASSAQTSSGQRQPTPPSTSPSSELPTPLTSLPMNTDENALSHSNPILPDPLADLRNALLTLGVPYAYVERLLANHDPDAIRQQIAWLPRRHAHSPSRLLVAAIEKDYPPPAGLRPPHPLQAALEALEAETPSGAEPPAPAKSDAEPTKSDAEPGLINGETPGGNSTNLPLPEA